MADDLVQQLESFLGSSYGIVRELGGAGMSRVFLADDKALGRSVVIKVLLPELAAGVNAERFKREVQLSARLQHPHVVPVLTAGEVDGLPYYVMPFVKGESLRARLAAGPLPIAETAAILADVAKALAYAHADGIVHRDIKPDNILLSGGASTVADFGIAKAISSARQSEPGETLTSLGMSLGTPAYMAPEQVAGDPNVDHRADIYSLGCVAYEMVTGRSPFAGKSPQQMLAAQVMETPRPIAELRPDAPPALVALVERCLEKNPAARPQSASDIVSQLENAGPHAAQPAAGRTSAGRRVPAWAFVAGIVVIGAAAVPAYRALQRGGADDSSLSVAVAPFEVLDPQLALWKEGMVDVLSRNLDGAGPIRTVPPAAVIRRWNGHADRTVAAAVGKQLDARIVVYGQLQPAGQLVDARAWVVNVESSAPPIEIVVRDSAAQMDRVTDSLSVKVLSAIGRDHPIGVARIASLGSGSLPAIKAFLQGSQYFRRTQWDSAAALFRQAVSLDSSFGIAYLHLAQTIGWSKGDADPEFIAANTRAGELVRAGLSPHDSLMLAAAGHYAHAGYNGATRNVAELHAAMATVQLATQRYPSDPEAWYWLGDMRYHNDNTLTDREALDFFDHAIQADSGFAPAYIHAIELAYARGVDVGRRYADAYLRHSSGDLGNAGIRLAAMLTDPRSRPADIEQVLDTITPAVGQQAYSVIQRAPDSAEVASRILRAALRRAPSAQRPGMAGGLAVQLAMHGHIDSAWKLAVQSKAYVAGEIAALGLVPADSAAAVLRPFFHARNDAFLAPFPVLALVHDTATLQQMAATLAKALASRPDSPTRANQEFPLLELHAYTALARGDSATATQLFEALPDSIVALPIDLLIRARLVARRDPRHAIDLLERHPLVIGPVIVARELERGRLAEQIGDRERAVDAFSNVAAMWRNTDSPQLRDAVREAKQALERLDADGRLRARLAGAPQP